MWRRARPPRPRPRQSRRLELAAGLAGADDDMRRADRHLLSRLAHDGFEAPSRLARAIIAKHRVALIELLLDAGAVAPERRHIAAAGFGGDRQRLQCGAAPHRRAGAHDLHRAVYRALVELLQFDRNLRGSLGEIEGALVEFGKREAARRKAPFGGLAP